MVALINDLSNTDAIKALNQLQEPKQYVRFSGPHKEQLDLDVRIQTIADNRLFPTKALLDCGSTGSCVNQKFVETNGLTTRKAVVPIKIYNADGSPNQSGPITKYVPLRLMVQDHVEQLDFAVVDLGDLSATSKNSLRLVKDKAQQMTQRKNRG